MTENDKSQDPGQQAAADANLTTEGSASSATQPPAESAQGGEVVERTESDSSAQTPGAPASAGSSQTPPRQDDESAQGGQGDHGGDHGGGEADLGLAGGLAKAFIHSALTPLIFFAMLAMGIMGMILTPRQEDPQISVPMIDIFLSYPGVSAEQVSSLAMEPLERVLSEIPGVKHVYSVSMRDQGVITVQFKVGQQIGPSLVKTHDKIQSNLDLMPPGVQQPLIKPKGIDDVPVVTLTLWSRDMDDAQLRSLGSKVLQNLKSIPNTGHTFLVGGRSEQVKVEIMPERLSSSGISPDQVAQTIRAANQERVTGFLESNDRHFTVYTGAYLRSAQDVANLLVGTNQGEPVFVRDIARVSQGPQEYHQLVHYYHPRVAELGSVGEIERFLETKNEEGLGEVGDTDHAAEQLKYYLEHGYYGQTLERGGPIAAGEAAITLAVAKKIGTNGVTVANAILERVQSLKERDSPLIPDNVYVEVTRNYGESANDKVNDLMKKLFIATGIVTILILLVLGWKPAVVVTAVIPVVLLMTVFSAFLMGLTIDRVSLFALIFSIGILVDDAIVVIENIYRHWLHNGRTDTDTAVMAVGEVGNPTILATFTVIAALLPMAFVTGMMGPYMAPIPVLGSVAMLFSLFAAFVFTPWLAMRIKPSMSALHRAEKSEHAQERALAALYRYTLVPLIHNRFFGYLFLLFLIAGFFGSMMLFSSTAVPVKMLPFDNKSEFTVMIDMPEGTALGNTANVSRRIAEIVREIPEVTAVTTYAGTAKPFDFNGLVRHYYLRQQPWQAEVHVQLLHKKKRKALHMRKSHDVAVMARELLTPVAREEGARITVAEIPPGPPVLQTVVAEIYGPEPMQLRTIAKEMTELFESVTIDDKPALGDIDNYLQEPYNYWRFEIDTEKAQRRGISVDSVLRNVEMAMGGFRLGDVKRGEFLEPTFIIIQVPLAARAQINRLVDLPVSNPTGGTVPLGELGRFTQVAQDDPIWRKDLRRVEYVVGDAVGRLGAPIYPMLELEKLLKEHEFADGLVMSTGSFAGPPPDDGNYGFEWAGEWTVTFETFRDMGIAFAVALVGIYILVVWEFGNFTIPAIIMAPIPLTLLGIVPGHWIMGAEFTATSMIGFIALAGIIVRNSILLVDFSIHLVENGKPVHEAVVEACKTRTRPIVITALALVGGSSVILSDPIFQGMAVSLLFGVMVSTVLTLIVIPLGCYSAGSQLKR